MTAPASPPDASLPDASTAGRTSTGRAVTVRGLAAGYAADHPVMEGVDLDVPDRGVTRLGGRNGTGKSTFVEVLSGYLPPLDGRVDVLGLAPDDDELRALRRVARTRPALYPYMTVRDHLALACRARGSDRAVAEERAVRLGLEPWLDENASTLSSGTAKKVWHVLSTVGDARLYVLDEPFNAVDDDGIAVLIDEMHTWAGEAAVLLVCHTVPAGLRIDHERSLA